MADPMTPPEEWSPEALSLLDSLWAENASMLIIRRRLNEPLGFYPSTDQVIAMARRPSNPPLPDVISPRPVFEKIATNRIERFGFAPPIRDDNPVRLVPPGTHKANAFSMLKGKP